MKQNKCWECSGTLIKKKVPYAFLGEHIGEFSAEVCNKCGETIFSEETSKLIDQKVKEKGLWGLECKAKVGRVGDSLNIVINKRLAEYLELKKGDEVFIYPENKSKLVIST